MQIMATVNRLLGIAAWLGCVNLVAKLTPTVGTKLVDFSCEPAQVVRHVGALLGPVLKKAKASLTSEIGSTTPVAIEALHRQRAGYS